jgi:hypothetical protein
LSAVKRRVGEEPGQASKKKKKSSRADDLKYAEEIPGTKKTSAEKGV